MIYYLKACAVIHTIDNEHINQQLGLANANEDDEIPFYSISHGVPYRKIREILIRLKIPYHYLPVTV